MENPIGKEIFEIDAVNPTSDDDPVHSINWYNVALCQHLEMENLKLAIQNSVVELQERKQRH